MLYTGIYCYNVINCSSVATVDFQNSSVWTVTINLVGVYLSFLVHQNYGMKHCSLSAFLLSIAKFRIHVQCIFHLFKAEQSNISTQCDSRVSIVLIFKYQVTTKE